MKKILILSLVALLILGGVSYARVGETRVGYARREAAMIHNVEGGHVHITTKAADVYRITMLAEAITTYLQLYNSSGTKDYSSTMAWVGALVSDRAGVNQNAHTDTITVNVKADLCVATAGDVTQFSFDPPLHFSEGILAGFVDAENAPASQDVTHAVIEWAPAPVE